MKFYKDKDSYVYNESLFDKQERKRKIDNFLIRLQSALLAFQIALLGTVLGTVSYRSISYYLKKNNPFDGQSITSSDFSANYRAMRSRSFLEDESIKDTLEYIKNCNMNEKKAYVLYYALISNNTLNDDEKNQLKNAIKYFCDNKYIDYEYVYNQLCNVKVVERNATFPGTNIVSTFKYSMYSDGIVRGGNIRLGNEEDLYHEMMCHGISKNHFISWIEEGYASIIDAEYNNDNTSSIKERVDSYPVETNVIRFLCEIIGKKEGRECFFKIASGKLDGKETALDLLSSYLTKAGIPITLCEQLYVEMDNFSEYSCKELSLEEDSEVVEILKSIVGILSKMYETVNNNYNTYNNYICSKYLNKILQRSYTYLSTDKFYYFNGEQINKYPEPITIKYFYPEPLAYEIIKKRGEKITLEVINGVPYIIIHENELSMCDKSKIVEYKQTYDDYLHEYVKDNETNSFKYLESYRLSPNVEDYLDYYINDTKNK